MNKYSGKRKCGKIGNTRNEMMYKNVCVEAIFYEILIKKNHGDGKGAVERKETREVWFKGPRKVQYLFRVATCLRFSGFVVRLATLHLSFLHFLKYHPFHCIHTNARSIFAPSLYYHSAYLPICSLAPFCFIVGSIFDTNQTPKLVMKAMTEILSIANTTRHYKWATLISTHSLLILLMFFFSFLLVPLYSVYIVIFCALLMVIYANDLQLIKYFLGIYFLFIILILFLLCSIRFPFRLILWNITCTYECLIWYLYIGRAQPNMNGMLFAFIYFPLDDCSFNEYKINVEI